MQLNAEQQQQVREWVRGGDGPAEVQRRLEETFGVKLTFMEVRFLIDDLDLDLVAPGAPASEPASTAPIDAQAELESSPASVEVDAVQRPGAMVSGSVTFSQGQRLGWQVDQMGRLGLIPGETAYEPSQEEIKAFQEELQKKLREKGIA
ncbi:MAG: hypothetical protein ACFB21_09065 [Opitutales bacterium]